MVLLVVGLMTSAMASRAIADGGKVQWSGIVDGRRYTVFTSPTPLQPGMVDISVLIQNESDGRVMRDATLSVRCQDRQSERVVEGRASQANSTNRLLQSAKLDLPVAGQWEIEICDLGAKPSSGPLVSFVVMVADQRFSIPWTAALVTAPLWFIAIYLLRERIRR
ncbi:hypothetical protein [Allorhodopirellula heiligendammensis]|uniref:hypothetical protein n=1 Tax=Allorhodopirellula heiligendammensis TaxID=2714739 RepID=UPI00265F7A76|nr:hypothetical protein [Allorhodopirellula heiligendammensis]